MILARARGRRRDFYEVLDEYSGDDPSSAHPHIYVYLGEMRASTNPLGYLRGVVSMAVI